MEFEYIWMLIVVSGKCEAKQHYFFKGVGPLLHYLHDLECNESDEIVQKTPKNLRATFISVELFGS